MRAFLFSVAWLHKEHHGIGCAVPRDRTSPQLGECYGLRRLNSIWWRGALGSRRDAASLYMGRSKG
jgi:hypothetical protein